MRPPLRARPGRQPAARSSSRRIRTHGGPGRRAGCRRSRAIRRPWIAGRVCQWGNGHRRSGRRRGAGVGLPPVNVGRRDSRLPDIGVNRIGRDTPAPDGDGCRSPACRPRAIGRRGGANPWGASSGDLRGARRVGHGVDRHRPQSSRGPFRGGSRSAARDAHARGPIGASRLHRRVRGSGLRRRGCVGRRRRARRRRVGSGDVRCGLGIRCRRRHWRDRRRRRRCGGRLRLRRGGRRIGLRIVVRGLRGPSGEERERIEVAVRIGRRPNAEVHIRDILLGGARRGRWCRPPAPR